MGEVDCKSLLAPNARTILSIWNREEISMRLIRIVREHLFLQDEWGSRRPAINHQMMKCMIWRESQSGYIDVFDAGRVEEVIGFLFQASTRVLEVMKVIGLRARLHPVSHLHHLLGILQDVNTIIRSLSPHQGGTKVMTPWVKPSFKYPILLFLNILSRPCSLVVSISLLSPSVGPSPLSM